jgi:hypothetical protein
MSSWLLEDADREPVVAQDLPDVLDRLQSGDQGVRGGRLMLAATSRQPERCHPAWTRLRTA